MAHKKSKMLRRVTLPCVSSISVGIENAETDPVIMRTNSIITSEQSSKRKGRFDIGMQSTTS